MSYWENMFGCFNSRSREGSDLAKSWLGGAARCFNSRSREGSDFNNIGKSQEGILFQFTLPRGERQRWHIVGVSCGVFQFTLPRGERPQKAENDMMEKRFNSRSREGSDTNQQGVHHVAGVSIHAPARGATPTLRRPLRRHRFQFTLPRGERPR